MVSDRIALCLFAGTVSVIACRPQTGPAIVDTGPFGSGSGYKASCNGDFPSWIAVNEPAADASGDINAHEPGVQKSFQLAQSYPLGIPVFNNSNTVDHYDPPAPNLDAPWRAYSNLANDGQRAQYLDALKTYFLQNMSEPSIQFDATKNNLSLANRRWFHVPMMTAAGARRREPYHGMTSERALRASEQTNWLTPGANLRAFAIGYYNFLGGYTIGQVFKSSDLSQTDPTKGKFIDGTLVFKLLFAEYVPSRNKGADPLEHAPSWWVQDPGSASTALIEMRLLQVDVAVKDDHFASTTGWVFATYVYDESLTPTEPNAWRRLTPVGIMWGNDPTVTGTAPATLAQTRINASMPAAFAGHLGRAGRLIGPVDDPASSCLSCHSTAQVDPAHPGQMPAYAGAEFKPPPGCTDPMSWFRNLPSGANPVAFGHGLTCPVNTSPAGLISLDYSLQLQEGVASIFGYGNANPCIGVIGPPLRAARARPGPGGSENEKSHFRDIAPAAVMKPAAPRLQIVGPTPPETLAR